MVEAIEESVFVDIEALGGADEVTVTLQVGTEGVEKGEGVLLFRLLQAGDVGADEEGDLLLGDTL